MSLLEETALALQEGAGGGERGSAGLLACHTPSEREPDRGAGETRSGHLHGAVSVILDGLDFDLSSSHGGRSAIRWGFSFGEGGESADEKGETRWKKIIDRPQVGS